MKNKFTTLLIVSIFTSLLSNAQTTFDWAKVISGTATVDGISNAVDNSGNIITVGFFSQPTDFDPTSAVLTLSPVQAGYSDIFITKYSSVGNLIWAKKIGGYYDDAPASVVIDNNDNIILTGNFFGTSDFDPDAGVANLTALGTDMFICKLNSSGSFVWAKRIGSSGSDFGFGINVDNSGNVYTTGSFEGTVDFDPGASTANLTSAGGTDIFVSKLNAAGNYVWAGRMGSTLDDRGTSINIDPSGNILTTGSFQGTVDFNPGAATNNLISGGTTNIFISKLSSSGAYVWAQAVYGFDSGEGTNICSDASGNVYVGGGFIGTADFDPSSLTNYLFSNGSSDLFFMKLSSTGAFSYARSIGNSSFDNVNNMKVDAAGNVLIAGVFFGTVDFDPGAGSQNMVSAGSADIYICKYNTLGNYDWSVRMGSTSVDIARSICLGSNNSIYTTGIFRGTVDFDQTSGIFNLSTNSPTVSGLFIHKMTPNFATPIELLAFEGQNEGNFNHLKWITASEINNDYFDLERSADGINFETIGKIKGAGNSSSKLEYDFDDALPIQGVNYYRLKQVDFDGKFVYSQTIEIDNHAEFAYFQNLFPNPSNGKFSFDFVSPKDSRLQVNISDMSGRVMYSNIQNTQQGTSSIGVDISNLPSGIYTLSIFDAATQFSHSERILKN